MTEKITPEKIREAVESIPPLSVAAGRVLEVTSSADHSLHDIVEILKNDSVLTAKLLKIVNSPVYGLIKPAETVDRAVSYLGERMVVSIVLEESVGAMLNKKLTGYGSDKGALWRHDLRTAIASREVAKLNIDKNSPDLAFTGGLLHDIGKAIMSDFLEGGYFNILRDLEKQELDDYVTGEADLLGINHARAGFEVGKKWQLPEVLQMIILYHHDPHNAPEEWQDIVYTVHLGDIIAMMGGYGTGFDNLFYRLDGSYVDHLQLGPDQMAMIMLTVEEEYQKIAEALKI